MRLRHCLSMSAGAKSLGYRTQTPAARTGITGTGFSIVTVACSAQHMLATLTFYPGNSASMAVRQRIRAGCSTACAAG
jgi:hypothetical protein